ncbi:MAG: DUF87 domain-containing protein [Nitrososphaeria archaeon]
MIEVIDKKFICIKRKDKLRLYMVIQLKPKQLVQSKKDYIDVPSAEVIVSYRKAIGFFEGIYKANIPLLYLVSISSKPQSAIQKIVSRAIKSSDEELTEMFEQAVFSITWASGSSSKLDSLKSDLEQRSRILCTAMSIGYEDFTPEVLRGRHLESFVKFLIEPDGSFEDSEEVGVSKLPFLLQYSSLLPTTSSTENIPPFYIPNFDESGSEGICIGNVKSSTGKAHKFFLQENDFSQHLCVVGMTGSGKSTTCKLILSQMIRMGRKVLVFDWHNEYSEFFREINGQVLNMGKDNSCVLNPLEAINTTDVYEHIALITDIFSEIYRFTSPQSFTFRTALMNLYGDRNRGYSRSPILSNLVDQIESTPIKSAYDTETKMALLRRLIPLTQGQAGLALNGENTVSIQSLLAGNVCVELGHFRDFETRAIFTSILLKMVYDYRLLSGLSTPPHTTIIEESRAIVPSRRVEDPPSIGEKMVAELRKFGECMIFIAQYPTQISTEIIKNSGLRIIHKISWLEDMRILRETLGLSEEQVKFLSSLKTGEAIVSIGRIRAPFLVSVDASSVVGVWKDSSEVTFLSNKL